MANRFTKWVAGLMAKDSNENNELQNQSNSNNQHTELADMSYTSYVPPKHVDLTASLQAKKKEKERRILGKYKDLSSAEIDQWTGFAFLETSAIGYQKDISNNASAVALGIAAAAATTGPQFVKLPLVASLTKGFSASALNTAIAAGFSVAVVPFVGAVLAGYADYYIQVANMKRHYQATNPTMLVDGDLPLHIKKQIWNNSARPLMFNMGAALFGAHAFTFVMEKTGLANMIADCVCNLKGSMPWQVNMVMMIASGVGLALFLTCMSVYQNKQQGKPTPVSEMIATAFVGLMAGIGAYAADMIPGLNKAYGLGMNGWTAKIVSGLACGAVITALFGVLPQVKEGTAYLGMKITTKYESMVAKKDDTYRMDDKEVASILENSSKSSTPSSEQNQPHLYV